MDRLDLQYYETLPPSCPPADAIPCNGVFYRVAKGDPVQDEDFFSQRKLQPYKIFNNVDECVTRSLSVYAQKQPALMLLKLPKFKNARIAELTLKNTDGKIKNTFNPQHYSWWRSSTFDTHNAKIIL